MRDYYNPETKEQSQIIKSKGRTGFKQGKDWSTDKSYSKYFWGARKLIFVLEKVNPPLARIIWTDEIIEGKVKLPYLDKKK